MSSAPNMQSDRSFSLVRIMLLVVPLLAIAGAWYLVTTWKYQQQEAKAKEIAPKASAANENVTHLDTRFHDADGDLVADPPTDAKDLISPEVVYFAYVAGPDAEREAKSWKQFGDELAKKIAKTVEVVAYKTNNEQLEALKQGKLHVTAFNTGNVPIAVNTAGFVPVCGPGRDDGSFGATMEFIVPTNSAIHSMKDLRGHLVTFTDPGSNSGCKAAIVRLNEYGLELNRDYDYGFSHGHEESIRGIAEGQLEVAPVASDLLQREIASGTVKKDAIRIIDNSPPFPPATLGYVYNLDSELADKIRSALLAMTLKDVGLEGQFTGSVKFVPIFYKNDFASIRNINLFPSLLEVDAPPE